MQVIYHKLIQEDLREALDYYETEGGSTLADRFFDEVEVAAAKAIKNPTGFHFEVDDLRRVRLENFPYHFLYRDHGFAVRFLVLRHDSRHPSYGLRRR